MEVQKIETFIMVDPDIEECIVQIENILAKDYHIYTNMKEIVAHAVIEMYVGLKEESDFYF